MNGESDGVEASPHEVHMWCGSSKYARARARAGAGGGVELWRNGGLWCVEITCEVQGDAGRAPVWEEGERVSCKLLAMR